MKRTEAIEVVINKRKFYVYPFGAFKASNLSGEIISVISPLFGLLNTEMDNSVENIVAGAAGALSAVDGDKIEALLKKLLIKEQNVAVEHNGETEWLTEALADDIFCGEIQDMYVLAGYVIKTNYQSFFKKLEARFGGAIEFLKEKANNTETLI